MNVNVLSPLPACSCFLAALVCALGTKADKGLACLRAAALSRCPDLGRTVVEGFPHFWLPSPLCARALLISTVRLVTLVSACAKLVG